MNSIAKPLETFFGRIATLQGTLFHLNSALNNYSEIYSKQNAKIKVRIPDYALGTFLVISDITGPTDNGWMYTFPTNGHHRVKLSNYSQEIEKLIARETGYTISQSYEAFSTFLKDQIGLFLKSYPEKLEILNGKQYKIGLNLYNDDRQINSGQNNIYLFKTIRMLAPALELSENNNNKHLDLTNWYSALAFFRHKHVHNQGSFNISDNAYKSMTDKSREYLLSFFPYTNKNEQEIFTIKQKQGDNNLILISEYAFLIFKELSKVVSEDWMILKDMKEKNEKHKQEDNSSSDN